MDRITESLISELITNLELTTEGESKDFEKLANYTVVSNEFNKTFDVESITVDEGNDTGLDGIAIIVNGQLVESTDEIDDLLEKNNFLEIEYIFVQAKTSANFDSAEINTFIFGIQDFFSLRPRLVRNDDIKRFAEVSNYIFEKAPKFRENPTLKLFFVTTGKWTNDTNLRAVIDSGINSLEQTNLFEKVIFTPFGARDLATAYRKTKESISTTVTFNKDRKSVV